MMLSQYFKASGVFIHKTEMVTEELMNEFIDQHGSFHSQNIT
jgi:hypothetical protein